MPINNQSLNKELYKILKVRGFDPIPKDSTGETSPVPDEADVFKYTFKSGDEAKGTAYATIDGDNTLTIYYGDDVTRKVNEEDGTESFDLTWTGFLKNMKMWAQRHQMGFELQNKDHLHSDMAQRNYTKKQENMSESKRLSQLQGQDMDKINEGYFPNGKLSSYNDNIPTVKIVLQHTRAIQEGEQRYRNVARIYLENVQGERILAPTVKPGIAQIYARHLAEGGVPNDERWNHIKSLCEEYSKMAGFVRAVRGNQFNESAQRLVEAGLNHYTNLRETLGKMRGQRGYNSYFESWTPTLMENEGDENTLNELFVQETLDPRIESVMPILNKLSKTISEVKEVKELEEWAESLTEAPGAETLAHNQATASSNLKAFDLEEDTMNEGWFADTLRNVGKSVLDRLAPNDKQLLLKLQRDMGVPTTAQHGKPSMARTMSDEEVQKLIAVARKVNAGRNSSLSEEEVEESGLQAYLGNKKYGKKGMDALRKAGRDGASKEKMAKIRAKYDKLDEEGVAEGSKRPSFGAGIGDIHVVYMDGKPKRKFKREDDAIDYADDLYDRTGNETIEVQNSEGGVVYSFLDEQQGMAEGAASGRFQLYGIRLNSKKKVPFGSFSTIDEVMAKAKDLDTAGLDPIDPNEDHDELHLLDTQTGKKFIYTDDGVNQKWEPIQGKQGVAEAFEDGIGDPIHDLYAKAGTFIVKKLGNHLNRGNNEQIVLKALEKVARSYEGKPITPETWRDVASRALQQASIDGFDFMESQGVAEGYPYGQHKPKKGECPECGTVGGHEDDCSRHSDNKKKGVAEGSDENFGVGSGAISSSIPLNKNGKTIGELFQTREGSWGYFVYANAKSQEGFGSKEEALAAMKQAIGQGVAEDLDANQKRVGQLGPTENVGPKGAVGKLVGANESVEHDPLQDIKRLLGK